MKTKADRKGGESEKEEGKMTREAEEEQEGRHEATDEKEKQRNEEMEEKFKTCPKPHDNAV